MEIEDLESWFLYIGIITLIFFMFFIVYDLIKKSKIGKFGTIVLLLGLCLGIFGFIFKMFYMHVLL